MVAKEWWETRWKFVLAAVAVLAFAVLAPRPYGAILKDAEFQIERTKAELASPEAFMPPEEALPPGYTRADYEVSLRDEFERMQRPDYPVKMAGFEMLDLQAGVSYVVLVPLAALLGVALVSGEVGRGTIFLLLSRPVSRIRIFLTKYAVAAAVMLAVALLVGGSVLVSGYAHGYPIVSVNFADALATAGSFWLGALSVLGVATLASVLFRDVIRSVVVTAVALYAISSLPNWLRGAVEWWLYPSPEDYPEGPMEVDGWYRSFEAFRITNYWSIVDPYYENTPFGEALMGQQPGPALSILVCLVAAALPLVAALWLFRRKSY